MSNEKRLRGQFFWVGVALRLAVLGGAMSYAARAQSTAAATGTWTTVAPMPTARYGLAAATGSDGRIYAIGGVSNPILDAAEAYIVGTDSWVELRRMPTRRWLLAAAGGLDGRMYAFGGFGTNGEALGTVEAYTPATDTWTTVASMPTPRGGPAAVTGTDGRIYVIGGCAGKFPCTGGTLNVVEAYTPGTNSWSTITSMSTFRAALAAAIGVNGRIYALAGFGPNLVVTNTGEAYSLATNEWNLVASVPTARAVLAAAAGPDGLIYTMGGCAGFPCSIQLALVEAYNPRSDMWKSVTSMPTARAALAAAAGPDGRIYAIGGQSNFVPLNTVEAFSPKRTDQ